MWKHIQFADGSNPYICKTEEEFKRIENKYCIEELDDGTYIAYNKNACGMVEYCEYSTECPHAKGIHYNVWGEGIECRNKNEELPF